MEERDYFNFSDLKKKLVSLNNDRDCIEISVHTIKKSSFLLLFTKSLIEIKPFNVLKYLKCYYSQLSLLCLEELEMPF